MAVGVGVAVDKGEGKGEITLRWGEGEESGRSDDMMTERGREAPMGKVGRWGFILER